MSTSLAVTTKVTNQLAVKLVITVTGAASGETLSVTRKVGTAAAVAVMGATGLAAATRIVIDPEVPLGTATTWTITTSSGVTITTAAVTVTASLAAVSDPVLGVLALCAVVERDNLSRQQRAEVLQVEGDSTPWVVWDVPTGKTMPVQLLTLDAEQESAVDALLATGDPILLRCACGHHSDVWIQPVGDSTQDQLVVQRPGSTLRLWDLGDCVVYAANPRLAEAAKAITLGDLYDYLAVKTLGRIADTWATLGAIAEADL